MVATQQRHQAINTRPTEDVWNLLSATRYIDFCHPVSFGSIPFLLFIFLMWNRQNWKSEGLKKYKPEQGKSLADADSFSSIQEAFEAFIAQCALTVHFHLVDADTGDCSAGFQTALPNTCNILLPETYPFSIVVNCSVLVLPLLWTGEFSK